MISHLMYLIGRTCGIKTHSHHSEILSLSSPYSCLITTSWEFIDTKDTSVDGGIGMDHIADLEVHFERSTSLITINFVPNLIFRDPTMSVQTVNSTFQYSHNHVVLLLCTLIVVH